MKVEKNKKPLKLRKKERQFLLASFIWCLLLSVIFIFVLHSIFSKVNITDLGTTFGAFVGVFVAFFGSILVYLALKAQVKANQLVQDQFSKIEDDSRIEKRNEYFNNRATIIRHEINNFKYTFNDQTRIGSPKYNYEGSQAVHKLLFTSKDNFYGRVERTPYELEPKLVELRSLLVFFKLTIEEIRNDNITHIEQKEELIHFLKYLFVAKIKGIFHSVEKYKSKHDMACPDNCGNFHGIPSELFELVDDINIKLDASL